MGRIILVGAPAPCTGRVRVNDRHVASYLVVGEIHGPKRGIVAEGVVKAFNGGELPIRFRVRALSMSVKNDGCFRQAGPRFLLFCVSLHPIRVRNRDRVVRREFSGPIHPP